MEWKRPILTSLEMEKMQNWFIAMLKKAYYLAQ